MKKGIVFAGCSFTWGQGLYYYSKMETLKEPAPEQYEHKLVTDAHKRFMATLRFPRLVANHFKTFEKDCRWRMIEKELMVIWKVKII